MIGVQGCCSSQTDHLVFYYFFLLVMWQTNEELQLFSEKNVSIDRLSEIWKMVQS